MKAFKYNEAKALNWLAVKCKKLAAALKEQNFHIGAKSLNYVKTEKFAVQSQNGMGFYFDISFHSIPFHTLHIVSCSKPDFGFRIENELLSYAFGIVSDYIPLDLCEKLSTHLGLEKLKAAAPGKRKSLIELENNTLKRVKSEEDFSAANIDTMSPPSSASPLATVHEKKVSAKEKQLAKAASGTKSISSFFSKK